MSEFFVTYDTDAEGNSVESDGEGHSLEEIVEVCSTAGVGATLRDAAGFRRGRVEANGDYRLS